jgi:hypothetical protein
MTRKSITTSHAVVACDVCGRTLLRGEHADAFIAGGARRMVCELCTARATNEGWIREGADNSASPRRNGARGGRSLLGRLRARRDVPAAPGAAEPPRRRAPGAPAAHDPAEPAYDPGYDPAAELAWSEAAGAPAAPEPEPLPAYEPPREPRHVRAVPTNAELKMVRALDVFNASRHPRTVSGVTRSLGPPIVAVRPSETEGAIVSIVVGWDLCWYRYEVDLADEAAGVRVTGQGDELSELTPDEQQPNAAADERGALVLAA